MHRSLPLAVLASLAFALTGCSSEDEPPADEGPPDDQAVAPVDDFAVIPATPADAVRYDFPEVVAPAAAEVQNCVFLEPTTEDLYFTALKSYQGSIGHHLVVFRSTVPEQPGLLRDCTGLNDMVTLIPVMSSVNFGLDRFPEGMAVRVPAGTQLVLQQHLVNTLGHEVRLRDAVHLTVARAAEVQVLAGFYGLGNVGFDLPPGPDEQSSTITCTVPMDMSLLMMGPHMHEWGTRFLAEAGPVGALAPILDIDPWQTWMRDEPQVALFPYEDPMVLHAGDQIRTTCTWRNTTDHALRFPHEMCASYGYFFPAPEGSDSWTCSGD